MKELSFTPGTFGFTLFISSKFLGKVAEYLCELVSDFSVMTSLVETEADREESLFLKSNRYLTLCLRSSVLKDSYWTPSSLASKYLVLCGCKTGVPAAV